MTTHRAALKHALAVAVTIALLLLYAAANPGFHIDLHVFQCVSVRAVGICFWVH